MNKIFKFGGIAILLVLVVFYVTGRVTSIEEPLVEGSNIEVILNFYAYVGDVELLEQEGINIISETTQPIKEFNTWELTADNGDYLLIFNVGDYEYLKELIVGDKIDSYDLIKEVNDGIVKTITIETLNP